MSKYCVIGSGFLATAFNKKLNANWYPTEETEVILFLGGPTHMDFAANSDFHMAFMGAKFSALVSYCQDKKVKLVYASSALVYETDTEFTQTKLAMESTALKFLPDSLGLRIYPVYGPGENRTAITKWCEAMKKGEQPVIYGDGTQKRDFIFVEDVVEQVVNLIEEGASGVQDIGAGKPTTFNEIIWIINRVLGTSIEPHYVDAPAGYDMKGIYCKNPLPTSHTLEEGIAKILK